MTGGKTHMEVRLDVCPCQICGGREGGAQLGMWICEDCLESAGSSCGGLA